MASPDQLSRCPLFSALPTRVLTSLAPRFPVQEIPAGRTLFTAGDPADTFLVVHDGALRLAAEDRAERTLGPGGFMGVASLLEPGLHPTTVTALEDTRLSRFDRQDLDLLWRENPSGAAFFHLALANRLIALLRTANERLVKLCELPLDQLDHDGLRAALQVVDDALDDREGETLTSPAPP